MEDPFQITKLDAARRQLRAAVRLLFDGGDPVAVHTLVGAASVIISDLVEQQHPDRLIFPQIPGHPAKRLNS